MKYRAKKTDPAMTSGSTTRDKVGTSTARKATRKPKRETSNPLDICTNGSVIVDDDPVETWAVRYMHRGWAVLAVWGVNDDLSCECGDPHDTTVNEKLDAKSIGKHPVGGRSWRDGTTDLSVVERWFPPGTRHNIAIVPGLSELLVVDVDGPTGEQTAVRLDLPDTLGSHTGNGRHLFYAADDVATIGSRSPGTGVDTRANTGYVVVAPSRHRTGCRYAWVNWQDRPVDRPEWLADRHRIGASESAAPLVAEPLDGLSLSLTLTTILGETPIEEKRSDQHYRFVARAVADGLTDGQILTLAARHAPSVEKYGGRLEVETRRSIEKVRARHELGDDAEAEAADVAIAVDGYRLTDTGNAQRLVDLADGHLRFVQAWGSWIVYRDGRWHRDNGDALVTEYAKRVARRLFDLVPQTPSTATRGGGSTRRKDLFAWAIRSESDHAIRAMVRLARGNPAVLTDHEDLDADPNLLNCANGTVDLRTGQLRPHDPADLMTLQTAVAYEPEAARPLWNQCLARWQPDADIRAYLQLEAGAGATGKPTETLSVHYGGGGNGKSKAWGAIAHVLGDYATVPHKSLLVAGKHEQHETVKADLFRKRLAVASETNAADALDEEQVKAITGGDRMRARRMREDPWFFHPTHTFVVFTNHKPKIKGRDEAIWRRVRLIPWDVTIPAGERDLDLAEKLRGEAAGILDWIVEGARRFLTDGFDPPSAIQAATDTYRADEDLVGRFVTETLAFGPGFATTAMLNDELERWCRDEGIPPLGMRDLAPLLKSHGSSSTRKTIDGQKSTVWTGVTIRETQSALRR
jgi:putative DNA primase/helicase